MILPVNCIGRVGHIRNNQKNNRVNSSRQAYTQSLTPYYANTSNISFRAVTDIMRFRQVDETLYRGARPNLEQLFNLKDFGISKIIDFSVEPTRIEGFNESVAAKNIGMEYFSIPLVSWETPSESAVAEFFDIIKSAKEKNEKVFIHCLEGKDRTGLFTELYKIRYGLSDAQTSINSLIKGRYNFSDNPCAVSFIKDFEKGIKS